MQNYRFTFKLDKYRNVVVYVVNDKITLYFCSCQEYFLALSDQPPVVLISFPVIQLILIRSFLRTINTKIILDL